MKSILTRMAILVVAIACSGLLPVSTAMADHLPECGTEYENPFESLNDSPGTGSGSESGFDHVFVHGVITSDITIINGPNPNPDLVGSDPTITENEITGPGPGPCVICLNGDCSHSDPVELTPEDSAFLDSVDSLDSPAVFVRSSNNRMALDLYRLWRSTGSIVEMIFYPDQPFNESTIPTTPFFGILEVIPGLEGFQWQIATDESFHDDSLVVDGSLTSTDANSVAHLPDDLLIPGAVYFFRVRPLLNSGEAQEWSITFTLYILSSHYLDPDENDDGIFDEHAVNGSGIAGGKRLRNPVSGTVNELTVDLGTLKGITVIDPSELPDSADTNRDLPYGLFQFRIEDLPSGLLAPATVNLTIYFADTLPDNIRWFKFDPVTQSLFNYTPNVQFYPDRAIITLTDGGWGDGDGVVNGIIVDPGGPATKSAGAAIAAPGGGNSSGGGSIGGGGGGGGGGCSLTPRAAFDPTLLLLLACFGVARARRFYQK